MKEFLKVSVKTFLWILLTLFIIAWFLGAAVVICIGINSIDLFLIIIGLFLVSMWLTFIDLDFWKKL